MKLLAFLFSCSLAAALVTGDQLPNISAKNQNGKTIHLSDYKGKYLLIYSYPKDETPGCTTQALGLKDQYTKIKSLNAEVLGISRQDEKSHREFIANHQLPFDLLVDTDGSVSKALGIGTIPVMGLNKRQSLLVDPQGKVLRFYDSVDPKKHADEVIADLEKQKPVKK